MLISIDSKIWGPYTWYFMHQVAFRLPQNYNELRQEIRDLLKKFYTSIRFLLPCPSCQKHYGLTLNQYPISKYNTSGIRIAKWMVNSHNLVNKGLKKKVYTYEEARKIQVGKGLSTIDYSKLDMCMKYILEMSTDKPLSHRKIVAKCIVKLYPCPKYRPTLINYMNKNQLQKVKTANEMNKWSKNLRMVLLHLC